MKRTITNTDLSLIHTILRTRAQMDGRSDDYRKGLERAFTIAQDSRR